METATITNQQHCEQLKALNWLASPIESDKTFEEIGQMAREGMAAEETPVSKRGWISQTANTAKLRVALSLVIIDAMGGGDDDDPALLFWKIGKWFKAYVASSEFSKLDSESRQDAVANYTQVSKIFSRLETIVDECYPFQDDISKLMDQLPETFTYETLTSED
ncbi:hypothetical protein QTN47_17190 [Danxiaibacter flavus]|uniref:Uncharacterized protein n=1 Tax=Danxiaibacter flavus TaxID=3049108 RepID=A0ABV3ZHF4_9BACT|nr:hypothetical protein QNM32_17200 [Chitinophagaceae bacterium DXS]